MSPNQFTKITQRGLGLVGQIVLIIIALANIYGVSQEILHIWET